MSILYNTHKVSLALTSVLNVIGYYSKNRIVFKLDKKEFDKHIKSVDWFTKKMFMNLKYVTELKIDKDEFSFRFEEEDYRVVLNREDSEIYLSH
jgi:hypothetical protein